MLLRLKLFWLSLLLVSAQPITVAGVRGTVLVEHHSTWQNARTGMKLSGEDKIRITGSSYIALILPDGRPVELRDTGLYLVKNIKPAYSENKTYTTRYTGYVLNQAIAYGSNRATGKTLGAVIRSVMVPEAVTPVHGYFYPDSVILSWHRVAGSQGYIVTIENDSGRVIYYMVTPPEVQQITINMRSISNSNTCYYWSVSTFRNPGVRTKRYKFCLLKEENKQKIKDEEIKLIAEMDTTQAISYIVLGAFYENHKLYYYAYQAYNRAVQMEPETAFYSFMRDNLMYRAIEP